MHVVAAIFWGCLLRMAQAFIEAAPTIVCGILVAAVLRNMVSSASLQALFGEKKLSALPRAWLIGTLLPVCSFGVIPVARELRRSGVSSGTVITFALTAPLLNPMSILYGLTLSNPFVIFCFVLASMIVAVLSGAVWNRLLAKPADNLPMEQEAKPTAGIKRLLAVLCTAGKETVGPSMVYILIGIFGVGIVSASIPANSLQSTMAHGDPWAPLQMSGISLPAYATPMKVIMLLGLMFDHGNSVGAAYVLLVLGAGMNIGLLAWMVSQFGLIRPLLWLSSALLFAVGIGYMIEYPLHFSLRQEDHTHAFDGFSAPFDYLMGTRAMYLVWPKIWEALQSPFELVSLGVLLFFALIGLLVVTLQSRVRLQDFLYKAEVEKDLSNQPIWNRPVPPRVLGLIAMVGLAIFAVIGAYIYYPDPETVFSEMYRVRGEALTSVNTAQGKEAFADQQKEVDAALRDIRHWNDLIKKLQVGVYIRTFQLSESQQKSAEDLLEGLEEVFDDLNHGNITKAKTRIPNVERLYRQCREAYLDAN